MPAFIDPISGKLIQVSQETLRISFEQFLGMLPTVSPEDPGILWNNGGVITISGDPTDPSGIFTSSAEDWAAVAQSYAEQAANAATMMSTPATKQDILNGTSNTVTVTPVNAPWIIPSAGDVYNAVKHGTVDNTGNVSITANTKLLLENGYRVHFPAGRYLIGTPILSVLTKGLWVTCHPEAIFYANTLDGDMFRFSAPTGGTGLANNKIAIIWEGGYFDQSKQKNSTSLPYNTEGYYLPGGASGIGNSATADALSFRGSYTAANIVYGAFDIVRVHDVRMYAGSHWETAGGDQAIYIGDGVDNTDVDIWAQGSRDLAVYISRDGTGSVGTSARVRGTFKNCFYGVSAKRAFEDFDIGGYYENCVGGVTINNIVGDRARGGRISGVFRKCNHGVRLEYCEGVTVQSSVFKDMGATVANGAPVTLVPPVNPVGVLMQGASRNKIINNLFSNSSSAWANTNAYGVYLTSANIANVTYLSTYNDISKNDHNGLRSIAYEDVNKADYNFFNNRRSDSVLPGATIVGTNSREIRFNETYQMEQYVSAGVMFPDGNNTVASIARAADVTTGVNFAAQTVILQSNGSNSALFSDKNVMFSVPLIRTCNTAITANGSTQAQATLLVSDINEISTVASGTGVRLRDASNSQFIGYQTDVINSGNNIVYVYPSSGGTIDGLALNVPLGLFPGERIVFTILAINRWRAAVPDVRVAASGGTAIPLTNTTSETAYATVTIPRYSMGTKGGVRVSYTTSGTVSSNTKNLRVRWSSISGNAVHLASPTTSPMLRHQVEIRNAGAANVQKISPSSMPSYGASAGTYLSFTVDTTADTSVVITGALANSADTFTLESYMVELFK